LYIPSVAEKPQEDMIEQAERARMDAHELSWLLRAVIRANADVDQHLAQHLRLRPLDYTAMNHIMTSAEPLGPAELSARLGISTGSGTELVDRLERDGHLRRQRHPDDRRRVSLHATDAGVGRILATLGPLFTALDTLADGFTPTEQDAISRYLRGVAQRLHHFDRTITDPSDPRPIGLGRDR
jgi:DNA-binding MarR family transcriptional regulator